VFSPLSRPLTLLGFLCTHLLLHDLVPRCLDSIEFWLDCLWFLQVACCEALDVGMAAAAQAALEALLQRLHSDASCAAGMPKGYEATVFQNLIKIAAERVGESAAPMHPDRDGAQQAQQEQRPPVGRHITLAKYFDMVLDRVQVHAATAAADTDTACFLHPCCVRCHRS
jgi:hypothetical protein